MAPPTPTKFAYVEKHASKLPTLHKGELTPLVIDNMELACENYFNAKDVAPEKQVATILGCFMDPKFTNWVRPPTQRARIVALTFGAFMKEFKEKFLDDDWETQVRSEILGMRQSEGQSFDDFATALIGHTSLLADTAPVDDVQVRHQLEAGMNDDLRFMCMRNKDLKELVAKPATSLDAYIRAVNRIDEDRRRTLDIQRRLIENSNKENKRRNRDDDDDRSSKRRETGKGSSASSKPASSLSSANPFPPKLTDAERTLLRENDGCNRCRQPFADHRFADCPNPMTAANHAVVTEKLVADARKARKGKSSSAAGSSKSTVAAILPPIVADSDSSGSVDEDDLSRDVSNPTSHSVPHFLWDCLLDGPNGSFPVTVKALIDNGAFLVIISEALAERLQLRKFRLHVPETVSLALSGSSTPADTCLTHYVNLRTHSVDQTWTSTSVRALIAPGLCAPILLGLPWLERNHIVIDHEARTVIDKRCGFDLMNPPPLKSSPPPRMKLREKLRKTDRDHKSMMKELNAVCDTRRLSMENDNLFENVKPVDVIAAVRERVEILAHWDDLNKRAEKLKSEYKCIFEPMPHVENLPTDVYCEIKLKKEKADMQFQTRSYQSPRKYKEAWQTLIQQNLDAGRIRPSSSPHASPAFLIPKADKVVLPRWINDFRPINAVTERDSFPLPRIDDILADCAKGKIWSIIDFTDSFFQTRMHPDSIKYTAVNTPLGLYEWLVMPQGLRNAPSVQQRRVTAALRAHIGKICHVYLDDIIIWSEDVEEHEKHLALIFNDLKKAALYCNPRKTKLFQYEVDFLGHRISTRGIQADPKKVDRIAHWPQPKSSTHVRAFLGVVRYLSFLLPNLADHTMVLEKLTTKECDKNFPAWSNEHQKAFDGIKQIVLSSDCVTTIDHDDPGENRIFVTCDASDKRSGAILSFGPTWETARPVAFDSMTFKHAELNYPVHEKEMLAIMRALHRWRVDLIGSEFTVYTDHRTLENFSTQKDLSRRQARWMEFLAQYDCKIVYVKGPDNTVADALSRTDFDETLTTEPGPAPWLQDGDEDGIPVIAAIIPMSASSPFYATRCIAETATPVAAVISSLPIASVLKVTADAKILESIRSGYNTDPWCKKLDSASTGIPGLVLRDGLWFVAERLVIPRTGNLREILFQLAHDNLGHFGFDKSYQALRDAYYWPNMRTDLEKAYIPGCPDCQRNKGRTAKKKAGPLHPLPIPEQRGDSVAIDFIGPLPKDQGFDSLITFTCRLGSDIRLVPSTTKLTAPELALLFFDNWYCENGLPLDIISDRDKLFMSIFWKTLHKLTGVKLKCSTAFHPQTDGASERTNKTVNQSLRYHVGRNQKGWVRALPRVRFDMMNTMNASTGFSGFQLRMGRSPRVIPPLIVAPSRTATSEEKLAREIIDQLATDVAEAQDNLLTAKLSQAEQANKSRRPDHDLKVGDRVKLSTTNRRTHYKQKKDGRCAKFMPRRDGPYKILEKHAEFSTYTLDLADQPLVYPVFHASELEPYVENDHSKFPSRRNEEPAPITVNGEDEWLVDDIIDERKRGRGRQYLVKFTGYGPEGNRWLPGRLLADNEALDRWLSRPMD